MRGSTAATSKGERRGQGGKRSRPDPNSKTGQLFAQLMSGDWVSARGVVGGNGRGRYAIEYLRSMYGMEIESGWKGCRLLGEWDGMDFVPVERMEMDPEG